MTGVKRSPSSPEGIQASLATEKDSSKRWIILLLVFSSLTKTSHLTFSSPTLKVSIKLLTGYSTLYLSSESPCLILLLFFISMTCDIWV